VTIVNKLTLLKYRDILGEEAIGGGGGSPHLRIVIATGDGNRTAVSGYGLPSTYENQAFTPESHRHADPKAREFQERFGASLQAHRAIADIASMSAASRGVAGDASLSQSGRALKLKEIIGKTLGNLGTRLAAIDPFDAALKVTEAKLLTPPAADHSEVILDNEIRTGYWRSLSPTAREAHFVQFGQKPELDRVLLAVRRSPIPFGDDAPKVDAAWRHLVARTQPQAWQAFSQEREATDWASGLVGHLASLALNPHSQHRGERLAREDLYHALKPTGTGVRLGNFQSGEVAHFEQRIAAAAAAA
jgi:hypothetical protein